MLRVLETCCHSGSSERQSADAGVKNSQGIKNKYKNKKWLSQENEKSIRNQTI